jgi:hypothetical protein
VAKGKNVIAFVLDPDLVQASEDGMTVPPLPGLWTNERAIHPDALGLTVEEMRDLVETLSLPLVEKAVSESEAASEFPQPDYLLDSAPAPFAGTAAADAPAESGDDLAAAAPGDADETGEDE